MPIDIYDLYKPLRNYMRQFALLPSLINIWHYSHHLAYGTPLPAPLQFKNKYRIAQKMEDLVFPWDLDILVRELILNAGSQGLTLGNQQEVAKAVNMLRFIDNEISKRQRVNENYDILFEMHRMGNRQFALQENPNLAALIRHHKINGSAGVEPIVVEKTGLNLTEIFRLGTVTIGSMHQRPLVELKQDLSSVGISNDKQDNFYSRITCTISDLRKEFQNLAVYTEDWLFTWNPLVLKPLILLDSNNPNLAISPLALHLNNRFTKGLYYDIVQKGGGFDNAYGDAFQKYVGEVLNELCSTPKFLITPELEYYDGKNLKHGVDWIVSDSSGHLFIECKTKRLTLKGKLAHESADIRNDLEVLSQYIVQHYKNILDAEQHKTKWVPDGKPIYFLIITLDQWWLFSPRITDELELIVRRKLDENGMVQTIIDRMPYTIASITEFEECCDVMVEVGIHKYLNLKTDDEHRSWALTPFTRTEFSSFKIGREKALFEDEILRLIPTQPLDGTN